VGVPVIAQSAGGPVRIDSIPVVTWNIHLGAARVDQFVADLRSGALTGAPVQHFVLLLQEARRTGAAVPSIMPAAARSPRHLGERDAGSRADIRATAERLGLNLFYVPSMRNGADAAEDRGNAILTTLPLTELTAIELPFIAQRRIAVAATLPLTNVAGAPRNLRVTSVHLDVGSDGRQPLALFGPGRTLQATALSAALAGGVNDVVGGDFNTWSLSVLERGLTRMQADFPDFPQGELKPTFFTAGVLPRVLDHLFLRAADVTGTAPARVDDRYGSDHFPVLAWIRLAAAGDVAGPAAPH
jgi:endonuclease/exonuclease/phosphatase family metal-dependent hydrolase